MLLLTSNFVLAREVKFEASIDKRQVAIGESAQLGLTFYETQTVPVPDLGKIDGFDARYLGPSTMMTVINGKMSSSITYMYSIVPLKVGRFQLGPFSFDYKGDSYKSNVVAIEVVEERAPQPAVPMAAAPQAAALPEHFNLEDRIFLTLSAAKTSAYVNELVPVTVKLYVNRLNVSDIQLPTFGQEGFSKAEFKEPKQYQEHLGGVLYDVLEFDTKIFGTRPGDYKLGPASIKCNIMIAKSVGPRRWSKDDYFGDDSFNDFFTRYERHPVELKSQDMPLIISPLPEAGKPADFSGTIGDYQFIYSATPKKVKVGDPVTITMEVNGTGNFNTVLIPKLESTDGFKMYEPEIKTEENSKAFRQVLIPETADLKAVPKAVLTYFDPSAKQYKTISQGPIPIVVEKGKEEAPSQVVGLPASTPQKADEEPKRDIIYIKEAPGKISARGSAFYRSPVYLFAIPMPLLFLIAFSFIQARKNRARTDSAYASKLLSLKTSRHGMKKLKSLIKTNRAKEFYEELFKTLQGYLGYRLSLPQAGITVDVIDSVFIPNGVELEVARKVRSLFETCDRARFALMDVAEFKMSSDLKELEDIIKYFERIKI